MNKNGFLSLVVLLLMGISLEQPLYAQSAEETVAVSADSASSVATEPKRNFQDIVASLKEENKQTPQPGTSHMFQGLALCLGVFFIGIFFLKKFNRSVGSTSNRRMRLLERLPLGQKSALFLVEVDGKTMIVGSGSEAVSVHTLSHVTTSPSATITKSTNRTNSEFDNEVSIASAGVEQ